MEEIKARELVVQTGHELLQKGLVARTWGNVSCRTGEDSMVISPSGLDYMATTTEDTVAVRLSDAHWEGGRKPSSEKGVHIAAYQCFPECGFVIHTHQEFASALSLAGLDSLDISEETRRKLGGITVAGYGLPGTKKLTGAVRECFEKGDHTVLMEKHGVVICAADKDEAMARATLLEELCRAGAKCRVKNITPQNADAVMGIVNAVYPKAECITTPYLLTWASKRRSIKAQLDDMAQMIGGKIPYAKNAEKAVKALEKHNCVLIGGVGAVVNAEEKDDVEALKLLVNKAAICALHTKECGVRSRVGFFGVQIMRRVYLKKYSKQKAGVK